MWTQKIIVGLFISLLSVQLCAASNADVQLQLTQKPDVNCDGIPESMNEVSPGECMIYEIQAVNTGAETYNNLLISARIPEHTILMRPYARVSDDAPVDSIIKQGTNGIRLLKTRLESLQPGHDNKVILHYSVRIM